MEPYIASDDAPGTLFPTAWEPLAGLTFAGWQAEAVTVQTAAVASRWWLGDLMRYGEMRWGEDAAQAVEMSGLHVDTLRACVWVAESIVPARRRPEATWSHHREVAAMDAAEGDAWLGRAIDGGWSRDELRRKIRGERVTDGDGPADEDELAVRQLTLVDALRTALGAEQGGRAYRVTLGWAERHAPAIVEVLTDTRE